MSHKPLRKETDCLNCGTTVPDRFCPHCGQENTEPHETFWHMVQHFLYDITHFDSKFFDSMKYLLLRPGFLPAEYIKGKRASYLNPVKKYVFTSAIFFILFFSVFKATESIELNVDKDLTREDRQSYIRKGETAMQKNPADSSWAVLLRDLRDTTKKLTNRDLILYWDDFNFFNVGKRSYKNREMYDSVQRSLPAAERDNWLQKKLQIRNLELKKKYQFDPDNGARKMFDAFLHKLPVLLFVSLPFFALLLKLLYFRRKKIYYADHGIFSIYHYIFSFFLFVFVLGLDKLNDLIDWKWLEWLGLLIFLSGGVYLFIAMRRFYGQGFFKTLLKFILLNIGALVALAILFMGFLLFSVYSI